MGERIKQALDSIAPGEQRILERRFELNQKSPSWYRAGTLGEVPYGLFVWRNRPDNALMPHTESFVYRYRSLRDIPHPVCEFVGAPDQLCDLYPWGDAFFLSERAFSIVQVLDRDALEWIEVDVTGASTKYFLCLCRRSVDAIDDDLSTIIVSYKPTHRGSANYYTWVEAEGGVYAVDNSICSGAHIMVNFYTTELLMSEVAVEALAAGKCKNLRFRPTDSSDPGRMICLY